MQRRIVVTAVIFQLMNPGQVQSFGLNCVYVLLPACWQSINWTLLARLDAISHKELQDSKSWIIVCTFDRVLAGHMRR